MGCVWRLRVNYGAISNGAFQLCCQLLLLLVAPSLAMVSFTVSEYTNDEFQVSVARLALKVTFFVVCQLPKISL